MARTAKKKIGIKNDGITLTDDADSIDFTGVGVTGSILGNDITEDIPGGASITPGGNQYDVQYNDGAGGFAGNDGFQYNGSNIGIDGASRVFWDGLSNMDWQEGINLGLYTRDFLTGDSLDIIVNNGTGDGFSIGSVGGFSIFELSGENYDGFFRRNIGVGTPPSPNGNHSLTVGSIDPNSTSNYIHLDGNSNVGGGYVQAGSGSYQGYIYLHDYGSTAFGSVGAYNSTSYIESGGTASDVHARIEDGYATANGAGSSINGIALGNSSNNAYLQAQGDGSKIWGVAETSNQQSYLQANSRGATSMGVANDGYISSQADAAFAGGAVFGNSSQSAYIYAGSSASMVHGYVQSGSSQQSYLNCSGTGGDLNGFVSDAQVYDGSSGGKHWGYITNQSTADFSGNGSSGGGSINNNSQLNISGEASFASIYASGITNSYQANIQVNGTAASAFGYVNANSQYAYLYSSGAASLVTAYVQDSQVYNYSNGSLMGVTAFQFSEVQLSSNSGMMNVYANYANVSASSDGGHMSGYVSGNSGFTAYLQSSGQAQTINGWVQSNYATGYLYTSANSTFTSASVIDSNVQNNSDSGFLMGYFYTDANSGYSTNVSQSNAANFLMARGAADQSNVAIVQGGQAQMTNVYMEGGDLNNEGFGTFSALYMHSSNGFTAHAYNSGTGSLMVGSVNATTSSDATLEITGQGSIVGGYLQDGESTSITGNNSFGWGNGVTVSNNNSFVFGSGISSFSDNSFQIGWGGQVALDFNQTTFDVYYPGTSQEAMVIAGGSGQLTFIDLSGNESADMLGRNLVNAGGVDILSWGGTNPQISYPGGNILASWSNSTFELRDTNSVIAIDVANRMLVGSWKVPIIQNVATGINAKTVANTLIWTNPNSAKSAVINIATIRCTAAIAITVGPTIGIGTSAGTNDLFPATALTVLTTTSKVYNFPPAGMSVLVPPSGTVYLNLSVASTGTSQTIEADITGYILP